MQALERALHEAFTAAGRQSRHTFLRMRPDAAGGWCVETTESEWLDPVWPRLEKLAGGAPLHRILLPESFLKHRVAWVTASVGEVRREPRHESEQTTQVLQGEVLQPLLHADGWALARTPDGYIGWIRDWHLSMVPVGEPEKFASRTTARVDVPWSAIRSAPDDRAEPVGETLLGTRVAVIERAGEWSLIELPGGRRGWLPDHALADGNGPAPGDVASILATLRRFYGVPYLWGGKSPKGFDCSGLVQFGFGLHGISLPRDADEQAQSGSGVEIPIAGDLLFFGKERVTHVGVALDADRFIHARGEVRCNTLRHGTPLHDAELRALWRGTRRVLAPTPAVV